MRFVPLIVALSLATAAAAPIEIIPAALHGAIQPQVAVAPGGRIHVVFGKETAIYYTASADGRSFSPPVKVGALEKLALGMHRGPRVAASDTGVVISAISHADGDLHTWTSADGGQTWQEGKINDTPHSAREGLHAMAGDGRGFVAAVWLDDRGGKKEVRSAVSQDGGSSWGPNIQVYQSPDGHVCECCAPSIAVAAPGRFAVMWRNWLGGSRDLYTSASTDGGKTFGAARKLGTGTWKFNACPMDGGAMLLKPDGKLLTTWRRDKAAFASDGSTSEQKLAESGFNPVLVASKDGTDYLWENGGPLMLKKGASTPVRFAEKGAFASAAPRADGHPIVVWQSGSGSATTLFAEIID